MTLDASLKKIAESNAKLNVFIEPALLDKAKLLAIPRKAKGGRLQDMPIAIKDNICVEGIETTCGSKILKGFKAPYHATVIRKLLDEGAIPFSRANMDEFAFGSSCETSAYGPTRNPWNTDCVPGGSSGGSAAAVASGMVPLSLGSDTGGSIRQPASFCGIVGIKPTYGRVSRYGLVAFASSLDQIGPFAANVEDAALLLEVIAGFDPKDSTSADLPVPAYTRSCGESIKGLRVGIPKEFMQYALDPDVKKAIDNAKSLLQKQGAELVEVSLPHAEYAVSVYYVIGPCEASSNLARFDGVKYGYRNTQAEGLLDMYLRTRQDGFGEEAKRRIIIGTFALSSGYYDAYYLKAMRVRRKMIDEFNAAFTKADVLICPTSPTAAFKIGEKTQDPLAMYLSDIFTISANLAGIPGISVPCGFSARGLPLGLQFMSKPFDESTLFKAAYAFQESAGLKGKKPA